MGKRLSHEENEKLLLKKPSSKESVADLKRKIEILYEEIARKDKIIEGLKSENEVLFNTSVRAQRDIADLRAMMMGKKKE